MREHAEARLLEPATRRGEQAKILKAAAGEDDRPWLAHLDAGSRGAGSHRLVERRRDLASRPTPRKLLVALSH